MFTAKHTAKLRLLAWVIGLGGAAACVSAAVVTVTLGLADQLIPLVSGYVFGILMGVLGALICVREPRNSIGWLMCFTAVSTSQINLPSDYAYAALVSQHGTWPGGSVALWFSTWSSIPVFGLFLPLILARFPDGRVRLRWRAAEWLALAGTAMFILSVALAPADLPLFVPARAVALLVPYAHNPLGISIPDGVLAYVWMGGLATILLAYVASAGSLVTRFRRASHDQSIQLKWFAYAGVLIALMALYAGGAWYRGQSLGDALVPFAVGVVALPVATAIAILQYRLYDIDLIINRTVVYLTLTALLYAVYVAVTTYLQRLFVSVSGQKSDSVYVVAAFVVAVAFNPIKDALQRYVNRRLGGATASAALDRFSAEVDAVVSVMDVHRVACRLVDQAIGAFDATGGELYLQTISAADPLYCRGHLNGHPVIEVPLWHEGKQFGRLVLGSRRGSARYTTHDREALQRSANSVGEALALAARLGHQPLPASRE